jgi:hypothetical protein
MAARDNRRRLWLAFFVAAASRRSAPAEKSVRILTAAGMAQVLPTPWNQLVQEEGTPVSQSESPPVLGGDDALWLSSHVQGAQGEALFRQACALNLEGIVSKRIDTRYRSGPFPGWRKIKCPGYVRP